jgi:hypothetical protein
MLLLSDPVLFIFVSHCVLSRKVLNCEMWYTGTTAELRYLDSSSEGLAVSLLADVIYNQNYAHIFCTGRCI